MDWVNWGMGWGEFRWKDDGLDGPVYRDFLSLFWGIKMLMDGR